MSYQEEVDRAAQEILDALRHKAKVNGAAKVEPVPWLPLEELAEPLPPIPWVCEALRIAPGAVTCLAGFGYSGKTIAAQSLLVSAALGKPVFGLYQVNKCKVAHADYEQGKRLSVERLQRLAYAMRVELRAFGHDGYRLVPLPSVYVDAKNAFDWYLRLADGCGLMVVDSVRAALPTVEENDSKVRVHLDMLSRVSERTGCAVVVIHHANKDQAGGSTDKRQKLRGSGALYDACQTVWHVQSAEGVPATWTLIKDRLAGSKASFCLGWEDLDDRKGLYPVHMEPEQVAREQVKQSRAGLELLILDALMSGPMSANTIQDVVKARKATVLEVLESLRERGHVGTRGSGRSFVWARTTENKQWD